MAWCVQGILQNGLYWTGLIFTFYLFLTIDMVSTFNKIPFCLDNFELCNFKGRTIIFLEGGMDISSTQTIFFGGVVVANNFFCACFLLQTIYFVHLIAVDFIQPRSQGFRVRTRGETRKPWSGPVNFAF